MKNRYLLTSSKLIIEAKNQDNPWNDEWLIMLKEDDKRVIGSVSFKGNKQRGLVPISMNLDERYQNQGYGTLAFKMMVDWAFLHSDVYEIEAVTEHENDKCICALEKAGFVYRQAENNIETYSIKKPKTTWLGLYIFVGFIAGFLIGIVFANLWLGLVIGLLIGSLLGLNLDAGAKKARQEVVGREDI